MKSVGGQLQAAAKRMRQAGPGAYASRDDDSFHSVPHGVFSDLYTLAYAYLENGGHNVAAALVAVRKERDRLAAAIRKNRGHADLEAERNCLRAALQAILAADEGTADWEKAIDAAEQLLKGAP